MPDPSIARFTYRAFISYSHRDKAWADWLHKTLETYRVPSRLVGMTTAHGVIPRRLNPIFRDREELSSSPELGSKINQALAQSENLIVICSSAAAASRWVNEEVLAYKRMDRAARIFCLIVDGEPNATDLPGRESEECFCPALRFVTDADGRPTTERTEPIAADARPGKDGKPNAKLKLIAGMLDVGFDALKQREQRRQVQRMTAIASLAVVVMAVTIVLAVYAFVSRHEAVIAQQDAQRRQKQAESLVDFMLGNLSDKLEAESRLDVMQDVDDHAMAYFKSLPSTDVNSTALAQRAKTLAQIGNVRVDVGQLPGALDAYRASTAIFSMLASAEPANVARQVAYSRNLAWIGMIHYKQGNLTDAQRDFERARQVLQPSLEQAPNNFPLLQQLTYVDNDLDHVLVGRGHPDAAVHWTQERLKLDDRLTAAKPDDADYVGDLGGAHNELGRLDLQRGDLVGAIAEYGADYAIETRLSALDPKDNVQRESELSVEAILGRTLALAGDSAAGIRALQHSVDVARQLSQFDSHDTDARKLLALYSSQLARLQRLNGNLPAARALNSQSVSILVALTQKDPTNNDWQSDYAFALTEMGAEARAASSTDVARTAAQKALAILMPMQAKDPDERGTLLATMAAKLLLASATQDSQVAQSLCAQTLRTMRAVQIERDDPRLLALQVEAMLALHQAPAAQSTIKQLWSEGYRDVAFVDQLQHARIAYPPNPAFQARLTSTTSAPHPDASAVAPRAGDKQHP